MRLREKGQAPFDVPSAIGARRRSPQVVSLFRGDKIVHFSPVGT
jgi:hypothetical protein